jgi:hypothetical protein
VWDSVVDSRNTVEPSSTSNSYILIVYSIHMCC